MKQKKCPVCLETKPLSDFFIRNRKNKSGINIEPSGWCKKCTSIKSTERLRDYKKKLVEYKGGKCEKCGYDKYFGALEFHHLNPKDKDPNYYKMRNWSWQRKIKEMDKCIMLCSNCHKEIEAGL